MSWYRIRIAVPAPLAEAAAWMIAEALDHPVEVQDHHTMTKDSSAGSARLVIGFEEAVDDETTTVITQSLASLGIENPELETLQSDDETWREGWKSFFKGISLPNGIHVHPPWETPPSNCLSVAIDPGMAFGTGTHATTRGVLKMLSDCLAGVPALTVLDVGCGSGILSIAAARLGHRALGVEIDGDALVNARENVSRNEVETEVQLQEGSAAQVSGKFPLVVANILAHILIEIASDLMNRCGGELILSGLLESQESAVLEAFPAMELLERRLEGEWVILRMRPLHG